MGRKTKASSSVNSFSPTQQNLICCEKYLALIFLIFNFILKEFEDKEQKMIEQSSNNKVTKYVHRFYTNVT